MEKFENHQQPEKMSSTIISSEAILRTLGVKYEIQCLANMYVIATLQSSESVHLPASKR
jgi:hypothetical protein